jgi:hypothetical protein
LLLKDRANAGRNTAIAPGLSHHAGRHSKSPALSERPIEQSDHALVTAIQGGQRRGVQHYPRRRPVRVPPI